MRPVCENCRFWELLSLGSFYGKCRRYPSQFTPDDSPGREVRDLWRQPIMARGAWCGEFKQFKKPEGA
jgi:hypothetical protein